jgi:group I intron endonuclease
MKTGTIYCITNISNGKQYIGQTKHELNKRWKEHLYESKKYNTRPLYRALNKYGTDSFKIRILEECPIEKLNERETYWVNKLDTYHNGYNATSGGDHFEHAEENKIKISNGMSNVERTDEWTNNVSKALKNKIKNGELWGILTGKYSNTDKLKRKVKAIKLETGEEFIFDSMREGARELTGNVANSGNICRSIKEGFTVYGYKWEKLDQTPTKRPVIGVHKRTEEIVRYDSMRSAAYDLTGESRKAGGGLRKSVLNPGKNSWMGYYWYYEEEYNPEVQ